MDKILHENYLDFRKTAQQSDKVHVFVLTSDGPIKLRAMKRVNAVALMATDDKTGVMDYGEAWCVVGCSDEGSQTDHIPYILVWSDDEKEAADCAEIVWEARDSRTWGELIKI